MCSTAAFCQVFYRRFSPRRTSTRRFLMTEATKTPIRLALIDISGTLHVGSNVISGGPEALKTLRSSGVKVKFVTNTSKESANSLLTELRRLGYSLDRDELHTSLTAARNFVEANTLSPLILLTDSALEDFPPQAKTGINSVIVGLAPDKLSYENLNQAFRILDDGGTLVAAHDGRYYRSDDGELSIGPGAFVRALEYSAQTTATVVGKPSEQFFLTAMSGMGVTAEESVMIGDSANSDCGASRKVGVGSALLVRTGKYRPGDENGVSLTSIVDDFPAAVQWILKHNSGL